MNLLCLPLCIAPSSRPRPLVRPVTLTLPGGILIIPNVPVEYGSDLMTGAQWVPNDLRNSVEGEEEKVGEKEEWETRRELKEQVRNIMKTFLEMELKGGATEDARGALDNILRKYINAQLEEQLKDKLGGWLEGEELKRKLTSELNEELRKEMEKGMEG